MSTTSFPLESDMVATLLPRARKLAGWRTGDIDLFFEVPAVRGVPDVVMVQFASWSTRDRSAVVEHHDVATWMALTVRLSAGSTDVSARDLSAYVGVSAGHLAQVVLPRLVDRGVVAKTTRGRWRLQLPYETPISRLVTVELKIRNRRGALHQAAAHGQGADRAWVVLDDSRFSKDGSARDAVRQSYASRGIGLATLRSGRGAVTVLTRPTPGGAHSFSDFTRRVARAVLAERVLALRHAGRDAGPSWPVFGRWLSSSRPIG